MHAASQKRFKYIFRILFSLTFVVGYASPMNMSFPGACTAEDEDEVVERSGEIATKFWPNPSRIPYTLDSNVKGSHRDEFYKALDHIHEVTCLRFAPRKSSEKAYIHVKILYGDHQNWCGSSAVCRQGKRQDVSISPKCAVSPTYVHELGHAICLRHEFNRVDRDEYLRFPGCNKPSQKKNSITTRGHMYDYVSQMSYPCEGCGGTPTMPGVIFCQSRVGFTAIDADKVNAYYNCKGCHGHRWYRVDTLTSSERRHLIDFASQEGDKKPLYLCRGFVDGMIFPGIYLQAEKACWIADFFMKKAKTQIQIFGLPTSQNSITNNTSGYSLIDPKSFNNQISKFGTRVGRIKNGISIYAGFTNIKGPNGKMITAVAPYEPPGKSIYVWDPTKTNERRNLQEISSDFRIIACGSGSRGADLEDTANNNYFYIKSIPE